MPSEQKPAASPPAALPPAAPREVLDAAMKGVDGMVKWLERIPATHRAWAMECLRLESEKLAA